MVAVAALLLMLAAQVSPAAAARRPRGRVAGAPTAPVGASRPKPRRRFRFTGRCRCRSRVRQRPPQASAGEPAAEKQMPGEARASRPNRPRPRPAASACRLALTEEIAIAPSIPDIHGAGGCGGEDLVRLEAVVLPDKRLVSVKPAAILRCAMASAIADWIRTDMAPLAASLGSVISDLDNFNSFECRGRNRVVGAQLSEHGRANALDVRA